MLALLVGGAIGWSRHLAQKPAGLRTYMLVSLGAALFAVIRLETHSSFPSNALGQGIQGIATRIGF